MRRACALLRTLQMLAFLERYFEFKHLGTNWRTEILAGVTTFLTMAYIVLVNPAILAAGGRASAAVTAATCLSAAFGSILMGVVARYPIALAPGMGLNAYFTYTVCLKMHIPWQTALGAVFLSGIIFLALTAAGIRQMILRIHPARTLRRGRQRHWPLHRLHRLSQRRPGRQRPCHPRRPGQYPQPHHRAGALRPHPHGRARSQKSSRLHPHWRSSYHRNRVGTGPRPLDKSRRRHSSARRHISSSSTFAAHSPKGLLEIIFVFFFVDLFDNLGTLVAVTKRAGLIAADHSIPRLNRILFADATATVFGSLTGTSTVTSYVESTAGVAAGGRSGVTAIVTGLLFLLAVGAAPFVGIVPAAATAPALILVGSMMLATITEIRWHEPLVAVPAFLTLILIPLTYSIANGLGFGIIAWAVLHLAHRQLAQAGLASLYSRGALRTALRLSGRELEGKRASAAALRILVSDRGVPQRQPALYSRSTASQDL